MTQLGADIDGEEHGDNLGWSVALSDDGTILAAGAPSNDGAGSNAGHVRVYQWSTPTSPPSTIAITSGSWNGFAYSYDSTSGNLYVYRMWSDPGHDISCNFVTETWVDHGSASPNSVSQSGTTVTLQLNGGTASFTDPF